MNFRLYQLFLFRYFAKETRRMVLALGGIVLGIALFVSTATNGIRAEKALVDSSMGFSSQSLGKIVPRTENLIITSSDFRELYRILESHQETIHLQLKPLLQREMYWKREDSSTQKGFYLGVDMSTEGQYQIKTPSPNSPEIDVKRLFQTSLVSSALARSWGNESPFRWILEGKEQTVQDFQEYNSEGGFILIEDWEKAHTRLNLKEGFDLILLQSSLAEDSELVQISIQIVQKELLHSSLSHLKLETSQEIQDRASSSLLSFRLNLLVLSMISVLISFFLVSNTMLGIYLTRRSELGILSVLGSTPLQNTALFFSQTLFLGILGTVMGIVSGYWISQSELFTADSLAVDSTLFTSYTQLPTTVWIVALGIGLLGSFLSALYPAIQVKKIQPIEVIQNSDAKTAHFGSWDIWVALGSLLFSGIVILIPNPTSIPVGGFLSILGLVVGFTFMFPFVMWGLGKLLFYSFQKVKSALVVVRIGIGEMASDPKSNTLTSATLMLSCSLILSLSMLTDSYEASILKWLDNDVPLDYAIVALQNVKEGSDRGGVPLEIVSQISGQEYLASIDPFALKLKFPWEGNSLTIHASRLGLGRGEVMVSSNFAILYKKKVGDELVLEFPRLEKQVLKIIGIRESFYSERGTLLMDLDDYSQAFALEEYNSIRVKLHPSADKKQAESQLLSLLKTYPQISLISSQDLKEIYLSGANRVFKILHSLKFTALFISLMSLTSGILFYLNNKQVTLSILESLGMKPRQIFGTIYVSTLFLMFVGSLLGIALTLLLAPIILYEINYRAFGWTLEFQFPWKILWIFLASIPLLSFLAVIYPFYLRSKKSLSESLAQN